jgi:hypothetical protein
MGKGKHKPKAKHRPKAKTGHCDICGEREDLHAVSLQVDGKSVGRSLKLCRSCTASKRITFGDNPHHGGWRR